MNINVIALSKVKDKHLANLISTYIKRLQKYAKVKVTEIKEGYIPAKFNDHDINKALLEESKAIISNVKERDYVVLLAPNGKTLDSVAFSEKLSELSGKGTVTFIIGSSYGVHETIKSRANETLSFSPLTFPHEIFRLLLFEQLFRAFKIINNETYHK